MARVATALLAPISVAAARIRRRPQRGLLAALGIAAATAMLAATIVGGRVSSELSVQRALAGVPVDQRAMRVLWSGAPAGGYRAVDPPATRALAQLAPGPAVRTVLYRETRFENSRIAVVTGVNDLGKWVTLTSGRLPSRCTPSRCEVVQVAGAPRPVAAAGPTRLVRVGTGRLTSALPFGSLTDLGVSARHRTPPAPHLRRRALRLRDPVEHTALDVGNKIAQLPLAHLDALAEVVGEHDAAVGGGVVVDVELRAPAAALAAERDDVLQTGVRHVRSPRPTTGPRVGGHCW